MEIHNQSNAASVMTELTFCQWIGRSVPGDLLCYHRGFLAIDRDQEMSSLPKEARIELHRVARRALFAAKEGFVHLLQRRVESGRFEYLAIARHKPKHRRAGLKEILACVNAGFEVQPEKAPLYAVSSTRPNDDVDDTACLPHVGAFAMKLAHLEQAGV